MSKTYRIFRDIEASNEDQALHIASISSFDNFRIQVQTFTDTENDIILKLARMALSDADIFDEMVDALDIDDATLKDLQEKIEEVTKND